MPPLNSSNIIESFEQNKRHPQIVTTSSVLAHTHTHTCVNDDDHQVGGRSVHVVRLVPLLTPGLRICTNYWQRLTVVLVYLYVPYPAIIDVCGLPKGINAGLKIVAAEKRAAKNIVAAMFDLRNMVRTWGWCLFHTEFLTVQLLVEGSNHWRDDYVWF